MASVLFVTWDGGGNVPPAVLIAEELRRRGDTVRFMGHATQRASIESRGLAFEEYRRGREWNVLEPKAGLRANLAYAAVFADRGIGWDVLESLRREPADRVVVDGLLIGALTVLAAADRGFTILVHTLRSVMYPALTSGPLGLILRLRGLHVARLYSAADAEIVVSEPSLDEGAERAVATVHTVGAVIPATSEAAESSAAKILVSLSTTYVAGQTDVLQRILDALARLPEQVLVTTGPAVDAGSLRVPPNATVYGYLPHSETMPGVSVLIGHGGHATTMLALAHGLPVLVVPMNPAFDQPAIGRLIAERGLGIALSRSASMGQIADAARQLLDEPRYRTAAQGIAERMAARHPVADAADLLQLPAHGLAL